MGNWASQQLSRVGDLVPDFDPASLFAEICTQLSDLPSTGPKVQEFCTFVEAGNLPVPQIIAEIEGAVSDIEVAAGDLGGVLEDLGDTTEDVWQAVSVGTVDGVEVAIGTIEDLVTDSEAAISGVVAPAVTSTRTIVQGTDAAIDSVVVPTVGSISSTVSDIDRTVDTVLVPTTAAIDRVARDTRSRVNSVRTTAGRILSAVCDLFVIGAPSFCPD